MDMTTNDGSYLDQLGRFLPVHYEYPVAFPFLFAFIVLFILLFTRSKIWNGFEAQFTWPARIVVSLLLLTMVFTAQGTAGWIFFGLPGRFEPEKPSAIGTALKLSLYRQAYKQELAQELTPPQKILTDCVTALSHDDAARAYNVCGDEGKACPDSLPPATREDLISEIKNIQLAGMTRADLQACQRVDLDKL